MKDKLQAKLTELESLLVTEKENKQKLAKMTAECIANINAVAGGIAVLKELLNAE